MPTARSVSRAVSAAGAVFVLAGAGWDLLLRHPYRLGADQLALLAVGIALVGCARYLRTPRATARVERLIAASLGRTAAFEAELVRHPTLYLRAGVWLGFCLGLAESAHEVLTADGPLWLHALWLGPVAYGCALGLVGAGLAAAQRRRAGRRPAVRLLLAAFLFLGIAAWLSLLYPRLSTWAALLLALGLAVSLSGMVAPHVHVLGTLVRRGEWIVAAVVVALMASSFGADMLRARRAEDATGPGYRNVLLLVLDTVRAKSLSLLGYGRETTPSLERRAREGIVFESAFATAPWTLPSHAGMFTGRWADELSADWSVPLDDRFPTLAEVLAGQGYATAGFVANLAYTNRGVGLARGFQHYEDFEITFRQAVLTTAFGRMIVTDDWLRNTLGYHELLNRKPAADINADLLAWLDGREDGAPFFAFVNYFDAHQPYLPPPPFRDLFRRMPPPERGSYAHDANQAIPDWWRLTPEQLADEQALYDGAIAYLDHEIDVLLEELEDRGLLDNTVVIVTADHGEQLGEHGLYGHGNSLYLPQLHVPLWILAPGVPSLRVGASVSLRDLPATVLDLAGIEAAASPFPGASLARFWSPERSRSTGPDTMLLQLTGGFGPPAAPISEGNLRGVIADPLHYILNGDGTEELYDFRADPGERIDLEEHAGHHDALRRLRALATDGS